MTFCPILLYIAMKNTQNVSKKVRANYFNGSLSSDSISWFSPRNTMRGGHIQVNRILKTHSNGPDLLVFNEHIDLPVCTHVCMLTHFCFGLWLWLEWQNGPCEGHRVVEWAELHFTALWLTSPTVVKGDVDFHKPWPWRQSYTSSH